MTSQRLLTEGRGDWHAALVMIPESLFWRLFPFGFLVLMSLWGLLAPRSHWRALYSWQRRYRDYEHPDDQHDLVFQNALVTLGLAIAVGALVVLGSIS